VAEGAAVRAYRRVLRHPFAFLLRVLKGFRANQGLLLSGAVAYYALLSIVPLIALILLALSRFVPDEVLLETLAHNAELIVPSHTQLIVDQVAVFLEQRQVVSWFMVGVLLFFSSMAFSVLENAMSLIFFHRVAIHRRHFLVSATLPYLYIFALGVGFLLMTLISGALEALDKEHIRVMGRVWSLHLFSGTSLYLLGLAGQILMMTSIYLVMPVGRLSLRHALIGGLVAGLLWEGMRHLLVWYFSTLSFVNVVYGSLASAIVALVSLEMAGMILLLGAQVIAEYERLGAEEDA
jgi:membrane protein